jgi:hypothetical protein
LWRGKKQFVLKVFGLLVEREWRREGKERSLGMSRGEKEELAHRAIA